MKQRQLARTQRQIATKRNMQRHELSSLSDYAMSDMHSLRCLSSAVSHKVLLCVVSSCTKRFTAACRRRLELVCRGSGSPLPPSLAAAYNLCARVRVRPCRRRASLPTIRVPWFWSVCFLSHCMHLAFKLTGANMVVSTCRKENTQVRTTMMH